MTYCSACGSKVENGGRFCPNCGQEQQPESLAAHGRQVRTGKNRKLLLILIPLLLIVLVAGVIMLAPAPVISVPGDFPTIQAAIDAAAYGDVIVVERGTYRENIDFKGKAITLRSTAPGDPKVVAATIIHGGNDGSVVTFKTGETSEAVLTGFTITGGSGTWFEYQYEYEGEKHEIEGSFGGGVFISDGSSPTISGNTITNNTVDMGGGGIFVTGGSSPTISGNTITNNTASWAGGISITGGSSPTVSGNTIADNTAVDGGGISIAGGSSPTVSGNTITGNNADLAGGISIAGGSSPTISGNIITNNTADMGQGGGIFIADGSSPTVSGNTIADNTAVDGGGIFIAGESSPTVSGNTIADNTAVDGGGISIAGGSSPTVSGNTITGNTAVDGGGGGISIIGESSPAISGNTITDNIAVGGSGGGIFVSPDSSIRLSTPDDNIYRDNVPEDIIDEGTAEPVEVQQGEMPKPVVSIEMENGALIKVELDPFNAPNTVRNFIALAEVGFYDGLIFHRVIPGFMIQGGCPDGTGQGGPGYSIRGEFPANDHQNKLLHQRGVISMARTPEPNSAGSQFFITVADQPFLDGEYAAFGVVIAGMDEADRIAAVQRDQTDRPLEVQRIRRVSVEKFGVTYGPPEKM